ncbi:enterotoxin A family protein [Candidatus Symbiopectobacterium endolongispinus]|uniref:enterotoxin A family protein n=1 Tax=Candidatus Symbiopectobacterium endolongispinus TaxID=2812664 RepID=UPI00207AD762|nr:enterotoxin A family protein [Candidatus Symbiopectobacterium endolongispinus]MBT9429960.1 hypothetical protein [Candidatus Symbiopectobacterium endolongispinus]
MLRFLIKNKRQKYKSDSLINLQSTPDDNFIPVNIIGNEDNPQHGPVNLKKRFDAKRWVTNEKEIIVYRQDNRSLNEIIEQGGFQPRTLEIGTIKDHILGSRSQYSYISTSSGRLKSNSYGRYEYKIKLAPHHGINSEKTLERIHGSMNTLSAKNVEYLIPGGISPSQIIGWRDCVAR